MVVHKILNRLRLGAPQSIFYLYTSVRQRHHTGDDWLIHRGPEHESTTAPPSPEKINSVVHASIGATGFVLNLKVTTAGHLEHLWLCCHGCCSHSKVQLTFLLTAGTRSRIRTRWLWHWLTLENHHLDLTRSRIRVRHRIT